jgi:RNase H-like domain found in reverse transcriptase/Integrase core domain/Integrase zinc binding domain
LVHCIHNFVWSGDHDSAFRTLKSCLFFIATDASAFAIGAVLFQLPENISEENVALSSSKNKNFIKFSSRSLTKSERNYPACKRELLAIVVALKKFANYVLGQTLTILTDSKPLSYMLSQQHMSSLQYSLLEVLLNFQYKIMYCAGRDNILPDLLSRIAPDFVPEAAVLNAAGTVDAENAPAIVGALPYDPEAIALRTGLEVVDNTYREEILHEHHALSHCNSRELYKCVIRSGKFWSSLKSDCEDFTSQCPDCQKNIIHRSGYHPQVSIHACAPMDHVLVNLMGPVPEHNNHRYILVAMDVFSRFIFIQPLENKQPVSVAKALYTIFCLFGHPKVLQTDNGGEFVKGLLSSLSYLYNWDHRKVVPYHPQANGLVGREVRTVAETIRKHVDSSVLWSQDLDAVQLKLNQRTTSAHGSMPFDVMFSRYLNSFVRFPGDVPRMPSAEEVAQRLEQVKSVVFPSISEKEKTHATKKNEQWNASHHLISIQPGTLVVAKNPTPNDKFDHQ